MSSGPHLGLTALQIQPWSHPATAVMHFSAASFPLEAVTLPRLTWMNGDITLPLSVMAAVSLTPPWVAVMLLLETVTEYTQTRARTHTHTPLQGFRLKASSRSQVPLQFRFWICFVVAVDDFMVVGGGRMASHLPQNLVTFSHQAFPFCGCLHLFHWAPPYMPAQPHVSLYDAQHSVLRP